MGFPCLETLIIYDLPKLITIWHDKLALDTFYRLKIVDVQRCHNLTNALRSSAISFQNLATLKVVGCHGLNYLITSSIAQSLMQLTHMEVKDCKGLIEIVGRNEVDARNEIVFSRLQHLELSGLPRLEGFFLGNYITVGNEIEKNNSKEILETVEEQFLFDKNVS